MREILYRNYSVVFIVIGILSMFLGIVIFDTVGYVCIVLVIAGIGMALVSEGTELDYENARIREFWGIGPVRAGKWQSVALPLQIGIAPATVKSSVYSMTSQELTSKENTYKMVVRLKNHKNLVVMYDKDIKRLYALKERMYSKIEK